MKNPKLSRKQRSKIKIRLTIQSCRTLFQLDGAKRMVHMYELNYGRSADLRNEIDLQIIRIRLEKFNVPQIQYR